MIPVLATTPRSAIRRKTDKLTSYLAALRTCGLIRRTVSILWEIISGAASTTWSTRSNRPWKSGIKTSTVVWGFTSLIVRIVFTQWEAPKSGKSSRSTDVITACLRFIKRMLSATFAGSFGSNGRGLPVSVLQKRQERVQISPPIMNVAVPRLQHSPIFGHLPLVHIVWRQWDSTILFFFVNCSFPPSRIFNQSGFLKCCAMSYKLLNK